MTSGAKWWWAAALVVCAALAALVVPSLPARGPETMHLEAPRTVSLSGSTVTLPAGWDLNIASTVGGSPSATGEGIRVRVTDGLWFGSSVSLVERVAELTGAGADAVPEIPDDAAGATREVWRMVVPAEGEIGERQISVVRWEQLVVLVVSSAESGSPDTAAVAGIVASIDFGSIPFDAGGPTSVRPPDGELIDAALERMR